MEALNGLQTNIAVRGYARQHDKSKVEDVERNLQHSGISVSAWEEGHGKGWGQPLGTGVYLSLANVAKWLQTESEGCSCMNETCRITFQQKLAVPPLPSLQLDQVDSLNVIHITGTKGKVMG